MEDALHPKLKQKIYFGDYCWLWVAGLNGNGYGQVNRKTWGEALAHRLVFLLLGREIPEGYVLDHLCRVRRCVRPSHLEPVTPAENARRGRVYAALARKFAEQSRCVNGHLRTAENTQTRTQHGKTTVARRCRVCAADYSRRYREERRAR